MHECNICGERFAEIDGDELKKAVSRHIWDEHSDHPNPDEPIVVEK